MYIFAHIVAWQLISLNWTLNGSRKEHMHRFIWNENDQSSRQSVKGTKKLPNKFRKNETIFSSSLANKSPVLPPPWAVVCYREYLTSPGKHLLWLWVESKLDMPFKSDYNLKWRWCFPIEPQLYKTGKIWTCSPTALELEATYGGLLKALSNEYILRYLIFI